MLNAWTQTHYDPPLNLGSMVLVLLLVLLMALWIDHRFGEPRAALHPVVWIGRYLKICGETTVHFAPAPAFMLGALAWLLGAVLTGVLAWGLQVLVFWQLANFTVVPGLQSGVGAAVITGLMAWVLKAMLSWRMLHDEAGAVEAALTQSLTAGRERLSWLVSRDTTQLSAAEVRESAIESLAENLNDSVVAPIFWFVLFGLPGAAIYRFANTADSMWGYRGVYHGQNWEWAGKWAARADDVLSWLPARLTAVLLAVAAGGLPCKALGNEAGKTPSPNSGWPMAAMALALGITLRKPGVYVLNPRGRPAAASDTAAAQVYASNAVLVLALIASLAILLIAILISP